MHADVKLFLENQKEDQQNFLEGKTNYNYFLLTFFLSNLQTSAPFFKVATLICILATCSQKQFFIVSEF